MAASTVVTIFSSEQSADKWLLMMLFFSVRSSALHIVLCREDFKSGFLKAVSNASFSLNISDGTSLTCSLLGISGVYGWYRNNTHFFHSWCDYLFILHISLQEMHNSANSHRSGTKYYGLLFPSWLRHVLLLILSISHLLFSSFFRSLNFWKLLPILLRWLTW